MGETKRIVTDGFPIDKLPEELRNGFKGGQLVRVTVEALAGDGSVARTTLTAFFGAGKGCYSEEEAVGFIRRLRDE